MQLFLGADIVFLDPATSIWSRKWADSGLFGNPMAGLETQSLELTRINVDLTVKPRPINAFWTNCWFAVGRISEKSWDLHFQRIWPKQDDVPTAASFGLKVKFTADLPISSVVSPV